MDAARRVATHDHLARVARAALGAGHRLIGLARLRGGSKKGVYRLTFDDDSTAIVYIWDDAENYWPAAHAGDHADPFSHASGIERFQAASRHLDTLGIRTPRIHLADRSRSLTRRTSRWWKTCPAGTGKRCSSKIRAARSQP